VTPQPTAPRWTIYKLAAKRERIGEVEAATEAEAIDHCNRRGDPMPSPFAAPAVLRPDEVRRFLRLATSSKIRVTGACRSRQSAR
jgi:hypothetical protein